MMQFEERRRHGRFRVELPAMLAAEGPWQRHEVCALMTRDISTSGAFLSTRVRYPVGLPVCVELTIALRGGDRFAVGGAAHVELKGSIIRAEPEGVAVAFQEGYQMRHMGSEGEGQRRADSVRPVQG